MRKIGDKRFIGRTDKVDLPDFQIRNISAKIDTGAYTSSIHCSSVTLAGENNELLRFKIFDLGEQLKGREFETKDFDERDIKNSFGQIEKRFVIKTRITIFRKKLETEFSLSDRSNMKHPVLLGRKLLRDAHLIVDVSRFNLSYKYKLKKKRNKQ